MLARVWRDGRERHLEVTGNPAKLLLALCNAPEVEVNGPGQRCHACAARHELCGRYGLTVAERRDGCGRCVLALETAVEPLRG